MNEDLRLRPRHDGFDAAWVRFTAYLIVRLGAGDYEHAITVAYVDGVGRDEVPPAIQLSRRGQVYVALGSPWLGSEVVRSMAALPCLRAEFGRLHGTDASHGRLVAATVKAFRDVLGVPHPAFLTVLGVDPEQARSFRSPYVEQDPPG